MTKGKEQWRMRPGDPAKPGTTKTDIGYNFALRVEEKGDLQLIFYQKGEKHPVMELTIPDSYCVGEVYAVEILEENLSEYEYHYCQKGKVFADPYARLIRGRKVFGQRPENEKCLRAGVLEEDKVTLLENAVPFDQMILYKVHVRGYTMDKNSGVKNKGTFHGLMEKISYWKQLGITSIELMPSYEFTEYSVEKKQRRVCVCPEQEMERVNFWGYTDGFYFAPKAAFCADENSEKEVKAFVKALHQEGMECIMDFYFPERTSVDLIREVLRFWKMEYGIDGFVLLGPGVGMEYLIQDGILAGTKLFAPGRDFEKTTGEKLQKIKRLAQYDSDYQNTVRRFLRGDEDLTGTFAYFQHSNPAACGSVHYLANHDGFTLADVFCYNEHHNEENGERNRDGSLENYSWNCGAEGATQVKKILKMRENQLKNAMMALILGQSIPLIYGGDEFGNSQNGNNNAYCQDNEIGWVNWSKVDEYSGFTKMIQDLLQFRKNHPILHMPQELRRTDYRALGWPDLSYHSDRAWYGNTEKSSKLLGVLYCGLYAKRETGKEDDFIYVVYNMHNVEKEAALPDLPKDKCWYLAADSERKMEEVVSLEGTEKPMKKEKKFTVHARTVTVLIGK